MSDSPERFEEIRRVLVESHVPDRRERLADLADPTFAGLEHTF